MKYDFSAFCVEVQLLILFGLVELYAPLVNTRYFSTFTCVRVFNLLFAFNYSKINLN